MTDWTDELKRKKPIDEWEIEDFPPEWQKGILDLKAAMESGDEPDDDDLPWEDDEEEERPRTTVLFFQRPLDKTDQAEPEPPRRPGRASEFTPEVCSQYILDNWETLAHAAYAGYKRKGRGTLMVPMEGSRSDTLVFLNLEDLDEANEIDPGCADDSIADAEAYDPERQIVLYFEFGPGEPVMSVVFVNDAYPPAAAWQAVENATRH